MSRKTGTCSGCTELREIVSRGRCQRCRMRDVRKKNGSVPRGSAEHRRKISTSRKRKAIDRVERKGQLRLPEVLEQRMIPGISPGYYRKKPTEENPATGTTLRSVAPYEKANKRT